ncbi:MAG TPA: DegT/DnrJ/EryC1/StrS family aminotransferase, partial [Candidatus Acidoferrales bacterium]|nr:DegT/DnrJ/EryC1/StrS family aminotransferase [Candidatus Acidoferrales bacterium]
MYARHRLDLGLGDLARLAFSSWRQPPPEAALVGFSVRSEFHLLLQALDLPPGSEVLVSAVTHPDMVRILETARLVAVPVDLDLETLAPRPELLARLAGPRTRLLLVAHLFGGRCDLEPALRLARSRGLLLVEDCAQAFRGPGDDGEPGADVSLFSFGTLKTATALGGALAYVRDERLRRRMAEIQAGWPAQPDREYRRKVLRHLP